ncbi:hypothetical protein AcV7_006910 [Taiwanofungus camphoratus]|nr:hypothetical protein AcV7_006910 [Antrodia cinnamomea]
MSGDPSPWTLSSHHGLGAPRHLANGTRSLLRTCPRSLPRLLDCTVMLRTSPRSRQRPSRPSAPDNAPPKQLRLMVAHYTTRPRVPAAISMHILVAPPPSLAPRTFVPSALHQPLRCSASAGSPPPSSSARTPPPPPLARRSHPAIAIAEPAGSTRTTHETHARLNPLTTLRPARARCGDDMISAPTECGAAQIDSDTRVQTGCPLRFPPGAPDIPLISVACSPHRVSRRSMRL